jgi:predicted phosphodiesterase
MLLAVISDVHANLEALEAVLRDIEDRGVEQILFAGDAVGYGPDPGQCLNLIERVCAEKVAGNHDRAVTGHTPLEYFNENARLALEWTLHQLSDEEMELLKGYEIQKSLKELGAMLVHASPRFPDSWQYILSLQDAWRAFHHFDEQFCFIGHSHIPFIIELTGDGEIPEPRRKVSITRYSRYIVNCGSVGQPRDRDPRAAYAIWKDGCIEIIRVEYDFMMTQQKMTERGLPPGLIARLQWGV